VICAPCAANILEEHGGHAGFDVFPQLVEDAGNNAIGLTHEANLFIVLEEDAAKLFQD
jgi:hypothetical protein